MEGRTVAHPQTHTLTPNTSNTPSILEVLVVRNGEEVLAIWQGLQPVALAPWPSACLIIALVDMAGVLQGDEACLKGGM